ncbi:MAG: endonuclease/exonuclease/phosphatase family protein [Bacteroidales bacterium]|nr:endonuclease/exonuclease/phosphatase family protein [Bacteroidales bacterium]
MKTLNLLLVVIILAAFQSCQQSFTSSSAPYDALAHFPFNKNIRNTKDKTLSGISDGKLDYTKGLDGKALELLADGTKSITIESENLKFDNKKDFSVHFWIKTEMTSDKPFVILSQKLMESNSLAAQKKSGWAIYSYGGTFAWNMGSGDRRIRYERDNGHLMPLNDGEWHQLSMTFSAKKSEVQLFYDGIMRAWYKVGDTKGFEFTSEGQLVVGWNGNEDDCDILPEIEEGVILLQDLVTEFNKLGIGDVSSDELVSLVVDPEGLLDDKVEELKKQTHQSQRDVLDYIELLDIKPVMKLRSKLMKNRYTVYQVRDFQEVAPLIKIYSLKNGQIVVNQEPAKEYTKKEKFYYPDFDIDELMIWDRVLTPAEIKGLYSTYYKLEQEENQGNKHSLIAADWNIHHGGIHNTVKEDGWDSRLRIVEMLQEQKADVVTMQETYSNGDYIAAELGYYFATTVDWDYLNQGSNISVMSRYPIKELHVPPTSSFMNVCVKVALSKNQDVYVMSNWYGMNNFPDVFEFHQNRFSNADEVPIIFAGDFNALPHTDGGSSPASVKMLESGFKDAFRELYPNVEEYPGPTFHRGRRIDQLYYKGRKLTNKSTKVVSDWPTGFPSDHFMIVAKFDLGQ